MKNGGPAEHQDARMDKDTDFPLHYKANWGERRMTGDLTPGRKQDKFLSTLQLNVKVVGEIIVSVSGNPLAILKDKLEMCKLTFPPIQTLVHLCK